MLKWYGMHTVNDEIIRTPMNTEDFDLFLRIWNLYDARILNVIKYKIKRN